MTGMTRLLSRYLSFAVIRHYALFTVVALTVASIIQFLENRDGLLDRPDMTLIDGVRFSVLSAPGIFSLLAGFIALVSVLMACLALARYSELKVMLAAGLSQGQLLWAIAPAALAIGGFHFLMDNCALPSAGTALRELGLGSERPGDTEAIWIRQENYVLSAGTLNVSRQELADVRLFALNESGRLLSSVSGPVARFSDGALVFPDAMQTGSGTLLTEPRSNFHVVTTLDFATVAALALPPRQTSLWKIARVLGQSYASSHPRRVYEVWLNRKLAAPLTTVLIVLLMAPIAQAVHRVGVVRLLAIGLPCGFIYFVADAMLLGLGEAGLVAPAAAAWGMSILLAVSITIMILASGHTGRNVRA